MIIDSHVHIGKWKYPYYYKLNPAIADFRRVMRESGVSKAVVMPSDEAKNEALLRSLQRSGAKKFWFFPWVFPQRHGVLEFLEKNAHAVAGLKFHGGLAKLRITNPAYKPFLRFAEREQMPVLCHAGRWQKMSSYKYALALAEKFPGIDFIIAHQGGDDPKLKVESARALRRMRLANAWFDTAATREFWTLSMGVAELGASRFLFGSDFPVMHPRMSIEAVRAAGLSKKDTEKILWKNSLKLLKKRPVW